MRARFKILLGIAFLVLVAVLWPGLNSPPREGVVTFNQKASGFPAVWACNQTVYYTLNNAPPNSDQDLAAIFERLKGATGISAVPASSPDQANLSITWQEHPKSSVPSEEIGEASVTSEFKRGLGLLKKPQNHILTAEVHIWTGTQPGSNLGGASGYYTVLAHELGHAYGLGHTSSEDGLSVMNPIVTENSPVYGQHDYDAFTTLYSTCLQK